MTKQVPAKKKPSTKPVMGRPSNSPARRAEIVDALLSVMATKGWAQATVSEIAAQAGMPPGLVHYHFKNKHQILVALVETLVERVEERSQTMLDAVGKDAIARLMAVVDAHVAQGPGSDERAVAAWVVVGAEALQDRQVRTLYTAAVQRWLDRLEALVVDALKSQKRRTKNAQRIAAAILAAVEGSFHVAVCAPGVLPKGFAQPMLARMVDGLLAAEERK